MSGASILFVAVVLAAWTFGSEWLIRYLTRSGFMEHVGDLDTVPRALMMVALFTVAFPALVVGLGLECDRERSDGLAWVSRGSERNIRGTLPVALG